MRKNIFEVKKLTCESTSLKNPFNASLKRYFNIINYRFSQNKKLLFFTSSALLPISSDLT